MRQWKPGTIEWRIDRALMDAFADRYYGPDVPKGYRCPTFSELWYETGQRASKLSPVLRWYWLMVDAILFKVWWHYHFLLGIKWYDALANLIKVPDDLRTGR